MIDRPDRPVASGLLALVVVAVALGLLLGLGVFALGKVTGVTGGGSSAGGPSLYLPEPTQTTSSAPASESTQPPASDGGPTGVGESGKPAPEIELRAGQTRVGAMQQIDLSGNYPGGDGAILQVQRLEAGTWSEFPVTASVSGGSFSTYVQTGRAGPNKFRVVDTDTGKKSNPVTVIIG